MIDLGPGAGRDGGRVVAAGTPAEVARAAGSATGRFLSGAEVLRAPARRRPGNGAFLTIRGARAHNLKDITVRLPLGMLVAVTHGLVDAGHTVAVVEHNPDVIRAADWVIDLGPEGGREGGWLVAEGTPEQVARVEGSHTGRVLRALL